MKKIIVLILLIVVGALLFGCTEEIDYSKDPKASFASFVEKSASLDNYYSEYVVGMNSMGQIINSNIKTYSKGDKQKAVMSVNAGALNSIMDVSFDTYIFGEDNVVMCFDPMMILSSSMMAFGTSEDIDPEILDQEMCVVADKSALSGLNSYGSVPDDFDFLLDKEISYVGRKQVAGKFNCQEFAFDLSYNDLMKIAYGVEQIDGYSSSYDNTKINYKLCFEEQYGILAEASYDINLGAPNSIYGSNAASYLSTKITLKDFRKGISDMDLALNTKIGMPSSIGPIKCDGRVIKMDISLLEKTSSINVSIKESNSNTGVVFTKAVFVQPVLFDSQSVEVDFEKELWDSTLVSICNGNSCIKGTCYANGYSPYSGVSETQAKVTWKSAEPFAIIDWAQTGSKLTVVLRNNSAETIEFNKFYLTTMGELSEQAELGEDYNNASKAIPSGATYTINVDTSKPCTSGGKFSYSKQGISIDYNTANIDNKIQMALADLVGSC